MSVSGILTDDPIHALQPAETMFRAVRLALVLSGLCLSSTARANDDEDKAVAFVKESGGSVTRDEKVPGKPVISISLSFTKVTDTGLKELAKLKNHTGLFIFETYLFSALWMGWGRGVPPYHATTGWRSRA